MKTRTVSFAGSSVLIEHEGLAACSIVDFLFGETDDAASPSTEPAAVYCLTSGEASHSLSLLRDDTILYEGLDHGFAADLLLARASHDLAATSTGGMLFHSAALSWDGGLVMLPAGIGQGKSTMTLWLISKGLGYLSDEAVFVPYNKMAAVPFRRPLSLKHPSRNAAREIFDLDAEGKHILASARSDLVHSSALNLGTEVGSLPVRFVIFPHYDPAVSPSWEPLTVARTAQELMRSMVNARNLQDHGFAEVVRFAKGVKGYRAAYSDFVQIADELGSLLGFAKA